MSPNNNPAPAPSSRKIRDDDIVQLSLGRGERSQFDSDPRHHNKSDQMVGFIIYKPELLCYAISISMRNDKNTALKYRLRGKSYNQITKLLGVPKSTLSGWFNGLQLSMKAKERLGARVREGSFEGLMKKNRQQTAAANERAKNIRNAAVRTIGKLSKRELLILGVSLYWGEGYKRPIIKNGKARTYHPVSLSNSDPKLVLAFLKFLREICGAEEEKIRAGLRIYQHQNAEQLLQFWSKLTKIPKERFEKYYYGVSKSSLGKRPFNILPYGTIQIRINDTKLFHKIMGWMEGLNKAIQI